ncbi:hypothetical protein HNP89_001963 [Methanococcus maripaludis]|uniref:Uncharacterized protein n=1 Tax=Methanococcus maripaludis TaxID=39152 RepID=A0A7J9P3H3_METMI|nr:hypothetical protein [Methanococcus maripaludis]MBA2853985.1 hypothetical protein [Methanococcus maripaludis]
MKKTFIVLRYYIIKSVQRTLNDFQGSNNLDTPEGKKQMFIDSFLRNGFSDGRDGELKYEVLGVEPIDERYYVGKFSKTKKQKDPKKSGEDIKYFEDIIQPFSEFVCDTDRHYLIIEKKSDVFRNVPHLCRLLSDMVTTELKNFGYIVQFEPVVEEQAFWNIIKEAEKVKSISFTLNAPNLFGVNEKSRQVMSRVKKTTNADELNLKYSNKNGELKVTEEEFKDPVNYVNEGGGKWEIETDKRKIKSFESSMKLSIPFTQISDVVEYVKKVLKK